jgi:hypothetical protein
LNFEPNLKLATPVNYIVGPGDELQITVMEYKNLVPSPVSVEVKSVFKCRRDFGSGMKIEAATQK